MTRRPVGRAPRRTRGGIPEVFHRIAAFLVLIPVLLSLALLLGVMLDKTVYETDSALYPRKYMALVDAASKKWDVPTSVIYAVIRIESGFEENAVSWADAHGLMQLTYDTYDWLYFLRGEEADHDTIMIPSYNIDAGTQLLSWLYARYEDWENVFAAYNAGFSRVNKWLEDPEISENGHLVHIPITETENYVRLVGESAQMYKTLYGD
ncbi:MAG: lytic transglycosylase domain-containing protein [Clostridia bacterium]|nr:lytic transglycosylase domain-containing protein [Clostridia bacterium]